jgi:mRNA interferase MazF
MVRGKVVLVPFPFDDLSTTKVRPAVCLTDPIGAHGHIILAFISSRIPDAPLESDLILESSQVDFTKTGLHVSSTIQLHRLMTVTAALIQRELGELSPQIQAILAEKLRKLFGITGIENKELKI